MKKEPSKLNQKIAFQIKDVIVLSLLALTLISGVYYLRPQNKQSDFSAVIDQQNERIANLEKIISQMTEKINQLTEQNNQIAEALNSGKVAGASVSQPAKTSAVAAKTENPSPASQPQSTSSAPQGKININSANLSELDSLPGIGPTYAQRIIDYRSANNGFKSTEEIKNVKGIGDKTFEKFKDLITI